MSQTARLHHHVSSASRGFLEFRCDRDLIDIELILGVGPVGDGCAGTGATPCVPSKRFTSVRNYLSAETYQSELR